MKVLDQGELLLLDSMAGDHKVFGAARISTGKRPEDASKGDEADRKLIGFLMQNGHGSPFEHAVFQWYVDTPLFVRSEWQRHRIGSFNEFSGRYAEFKPKFYVPDHLRIPDPNNKQSSIRFDGSLPEPLSYDPEEDSAEKYAGIVRSASEQSLSVYHQFLRSGISKEMARIVLPVNMYTQFWWTVNARALMNFLKLRNSPGAQWEIRQYAIGLEEIFAEAMPWTYEAFIANGRQAP